VSSIFTFLSGAPARARGRGRPEVPYASWRITAALVMIGMLMCGALVLATRSHGKSVRAAAAARHQRQDTFAAEQGAAAFWQEREAMAERLAFPRRAYRDAVRKIELQFRVALEAIQQNSPEEEALIEQATGANDALIAIFTSLLPLSGVASDAQGARRLQATERSVLAPIARLTAVNRRDYLITEARAGSAERAAYRSEIVTSLLGLIAVIWFAIFAARLVRRIGKQNVELRLADLAKDEFISTVSHELRTPLTSMHGFVEMLLDDRDDPLSDEQRHFVTTVQRGSIRLERLVNDLLLTAQLRAGPLDVRMTNTDLVEIARDSVVDAQAYATLKALQLTLADPSGAIMIEADVVRIGQALDNLISNAIKFTPEGGRVDITLAEDGDRATLTVSDTGMGMTSTDIKRLFEPFFRTDSAQAKQIQGTGLGLPIVKAIVEAHNGTINITSEPNTGTVFVVSLPLAPPLRTRDVASQAPRLVAA
jgi:signal transduction histidine kinase